MKGRGTRSPVWGIRYRLILWQPYCAWRRFPVRDLSASLAHYKRLGFETREYEGGGYGFVTRDGIEIHLGLVAEISPASAKHSAYLWVDDADQLADMWRAAGAEVHMPQDTEWGQHEVLSSTPTATFSDLARPSIDGVPQSAGCGRYARTAVRPDSNRV